MKTLILAVGLIAVVSSAAGEPLNAADERSLNAFANAVAKIKENYVRPFDTGEFIDNALTGAVGSLDPHSSYLTKQQLGELAGRNSESMGDVGLALARRDGVLTVVSPIDGTPAAKVGLRRGDVVLEINGVLVTGLPLPSALGSLRGPIGSKVTLKIIRSGACMPTVLTLTRAAVQFNSVTYRKEGAYGYIRIAELNGSTSDDVRAAINHLADVKGYVLDLRNNPGGLLDSAVSVAREFINKGTIVSTRGNSDNQTFSARGSDLANGKPIAVLVNGGTASGAEVVAGALQDYHRAIVIGTPTFGEGSVQTIIPFNGGALRLTTALMVLPSGRLIQGAGIEPDKLVSDLPHDADTNNIPNTFKSASGHTQDSSGPLISQEVSYPALGRTNDFQLTTAIALLNGGAP